MQASACIVQAEAVAPRSIHHCTLLGSKKWQRETCSKKKTVEFPPVRAHCTAHTAHSSPPKSRYVPTLQEQITLAVS